MGRILRENPGTRGDSLLPRKLTARSSAALRHNPNEKGFNPHLRQLLHVGYKIAAKMGQRYLEALQSHKASVARNVTENLFERHFKPLFLNPV
jgi:hypothetical protein